MLEGSWYLYYYNDMPDDSCPDITRNTRKMEIICITNDTPPQSHCSNKHPTPQQTATDYVNTPPLHNHRILCVSPQLSRMTFPLLYTSAG